MANEEEPVEGQEEQPAENADEQNTEEQSAVEPEEAAGEEPAEEPATAEVDPVHELSTPSVINIAALLTPIAGENPSGEYMRYSGIYDELSEARRADDTMNQGAWQGEVKVADFRKVVEAAIPVLETQTKDLQLAAWLCEALVSEHGFAGLRDGLKLVSGFLLKFWPSLYPESDEGDEEGRANALAWIDREAGLLIKHAPITSDGWGLSGFEDSKKFKIPDNPESLSSDEQLKASKLREQAERENRATDMQWNVAVAKTSRAFCEEVEVAINECLAEYDKLNRAIEETFDRNQAPSLPEMKRALSEIKSQADKLLEQKKLEEPSDSDFDESDEEGSSEEGGSRAAAGTSGAIQGRQDALRRLSEIAAFFKKTEPHSPVSYLVNRAVSWGSMPLETWLQDVIKDQNILTQLRQTLGFNTVAGTEETGGTPADTPQPPSQSLQ